MKLGPQQIEDFERDGYLFFSNRFDAAEVGILKQAALEVYRLERDEVWREKSGVARTAFAAHTYNEAFRRFKRPEWVAHRDFTPIEALADDALAELAAGSAA